MCGIWGIVSRTGAGLLESDMDAVKMLMLTTVYRGEHSTGVFVTDYRAPKAAVTGLKVEGGPHNIIYNKPLWKELCDYVHMNGGAVVGHGRYATRGKINAKNAHPFVHKHITLVHNGTIYNGLSYAKKEEEEIEVDSHALAVAIAERGIEEALTDINGAYAVIVHDAEEGCLYIARNKDRPLWMYEADSRFYFMSEPFYLRPTVILANKLKDGTSCAQLKEDILFKIDLDNPKELQIVRNLKEYSEEKRAKKWKAEQEEREKRALSYKNTSAGNTHVWPNAKPHTPMVVSFEVLSISGPGGSGNFTYECETVDKRLVYFMSNREIPDYIGQVGKAHVNRAHYKMGKEWLFVKHRDIEWEKEDQKGAEEEDPMTGVYFLTANRKKIKDTVWDHRRTHEGCDHCDATFGPRDFNRVILTDDDKLVCTRCYESFITPTIH